jgi:hypothetical protein
LQDLKNILNKFAEERNFSEILPLEKLQFIPALAYLKEFTPSTDDDILNLQVVDLDNVVTNKPLI